MSEEGEECGSSEGSKTGSSNEAVYSPSESGFYFFGEMKKCLFSRKERSRNEMVSNGHFDRAGVRGRDWPGKKYPKIRLAVLAFSTMIAHFIF